MLHHLTFGRNIGTQGYVTDLDWELYCQEVLDSNFDGYTVQDAIDRDVANGTLTPITDSAQHRIDAQNRGTYDVYIEIDIDCEELVEACGLDYTRSADDDTQNEICISLDKDEFCDVFETIQMTKINEQVIAERILNPELGEYTTKVTVYKPSGDIISFY